MSTEYRRRRPRPLLAYMFTVVALSHVAWAVAFFATGRSSEGGLQFSFACIWGALAAVATQAWVAAQRAEGDDQ